MTIATRIKMDLNTWAKKWNITDDAIADFKLQIGTASIGEQPGYDELSEAGILSQVRLEASQKGARLWRNNVGATYTNRGDFLRFGLANDSAILNKKLKSADLIGLKPVLITQEMVGTLIGQFLSREIKKSGWRFNGNEREIAQENWIKLILSLGGDAAFTTGEGSI